VRHLSSSGYWVMSPTYVTIQFACTGLIIHFGLDCKMYWLCIKTCNFHYFQEIIILSRMRGLRDEYNGFFIGWLNLLALILQLLSTKTQQLTINGCLRLALLFMNTSVFSSTLTDLVPIYESVTSSASVVRWLTLHSWTLNNASNDECQATTHLIINWTLL
jgi:hypothetical protein